MTDFILRRHLKRCTRICGTTSVMIRLLIYFLVAVAYEYTQQKSTPRIKKYTKSLKETSPGLAKVSFMSSIK